jgi:hypothetical protein
VEVLAIFTDWGIDSWILTVVFLRLGSNLCWPLVWYMHFLIDLGFLIDSTICLDFAGF